jgi:transporter family-2 protein
MLIVLVGLSLVLGALLTVQAGANAHLRLFLGSPLLAAVVNFVVGLVAIVGVGIAARVPLPALAAASRAPWWSWTGGLIGATYVASAVVLAPRLGASLFFAALVAGQLMGAVLVDHYGWLGFAQQRITLTKLLGLGLLVAGVLLVRREN